MLKKLWNRSKNHDELVREATQRINREREHVYRLRGFVTKWAESEIEHDWFIEQYRIWQLGYRGVDDPMWRLNRADALQLMLDHDETTRYALGACDAISELRRTQFAAAAPPAVKQRQLIASLDAPLMPLENRNYRRYGANPDEKTLRPS